MEKSLKKLVRISLVLRNWTLLMNYNVPVLSLQCISSNYSTNSKGASIKEQLPKQRNRQHELNTRSAFDILDAVQCNHKDLNSRDIVNTLISLSKLLKTVPDASNIINHNGFSLLCKMLTSNLRALSVPEAVKALRAIMQLQIPSTSIIVQSLLQYLRCSVNELSIPDIIAVHVLLEKCQDAPLNKALYIALPIVFQSQLNTKLDTDNPVVLARALQFANKIQFQQGIDFILHVMEKLEQNVSVHEAVHVYLALCTTEYHCNKHLHILNNMREVILRHEQDLTESNVSVLLRFTTKSIQRGNREFYSEAFIDGLVNNALYKDVSFADITYIMKELVHISHTHIPLLDYVAAKCYEQPSLLYESFPRRVLNLLRAFSTADYKPVFWDLIRETIIQPEFREKSSEILCCYFSLYLAALDYFCPEMIEKAFKVEPASLTDESIVKLAFLYQSVKVLCPSYNGAWPDSAVVERIDMCLQQFPQQFDTHSLQTHLEQALGGVHYVQSSLKTRLGHWIDHVVVMRKGGFPVAINNIDVNNSPYVEDLQPPPDSQTILIMNLPNVAYSVNSRRLKSTWALRLRSAQALTGFTTIGINSAEWYELPEYEKVPYLMKAIRLNCSECYNYTP